MGENACSVSWIPFVVKLTYTGVVYLTCKQLARSTFTTWKGELAKGTVNNEWKLRSSFRTGGKGIIATAFVEWYLGVNGIKEKACGRTFHADETRILIDKVSRMALMEHFLEYCWDYKIHEHHPAWYLDKKDGGTRLHPISETKIMLTWHERMDDPIKVGFLVLFPLL